MSSQPGIPVKEVVARGIRRRYRSERFFRALGLVALCIGLGFLAFFFYTLLANSYTALRQTRVLLDIDFDAAVIDPDGKRDPATLATADYQRLARDALNGLFPDVTSRAERRDLYGMLSAGAGLELRSRVTKNPSLIGTMRPLWLLLDDDVDVVVKGHISRNLPQSRATPGRSAAWLAHGARDPGPGAATVQHVLFHQRRLPRSRARGNLERDGRLVLHVARDARAIVPDRRRSRHLSRGVRAAQSLDRPHRGQHQQPRGRAVDRVRPARVWRCSSTCSACRARRRSSAGWS